MGQLEREFEPRHPRSLCGQHVGRVHCQRQAPELPLRDVPALGWGHVSAPDCTWHWNPVVS